MKDICPPIQCTGCAACANICPKRCIKMLQDKYGFLRPAINYTLCINCGLCQTVCPNNNPIAKNYPNICFAGWSIDYADRETSSSGGIASVLSNFTIEKGGIVYGAINIKTNVLHARCKKKSEVTQLKGSKYVQSYISENLFKQIKKDIDNHLNVLFIGTPCQIAGLKNFLKNDSYKVLYIDIICHGTPSQKILKDHIQSICTISEVESIHFRDASSSDYFLTLKDNNGTILYRNNFPNDFYLNGFMYALFSRSSCYQCHYASPERISDITIGDFWGLGNTNYPKKKVSVILCNTPKGETIINDVHDRLFLDSRPIEEAIKGNLQLQAPSKKHEFYNLFHTLYPYIGYRITIHICLAKFYIKHQVFKLLYSNKNFRNYYNNKKS